MPRGQFDGLRLELANGERVHVYGRAELYARRGSLHLRALTIERFGLGAHLLALERLKQKLASEGLFAAERKLRRSPHPKPDRAHHGKRRCRETRRPRRHHVALPPGQRARRRRRVRARLRGAACWAIETRDGRAVRSGGGRPRDRARRGQFRRPSAVLGRRARARRVRLPRAGRERDRARAGCLARRPRSRPPRIDTFGRRQAGRPGSGGVALLAGAHAARTGTGARGDSEQRRAEALDHTWARLRRAPRHELERRRARVESSRSHLRALSPTATLARGYAIVRAGERVVREPPAKGTELAVEVAAGSFGARTL